MDFLYLRVHTIHNYPSLVSSLDSLLDEGYEALKHLNVGQVGMRRMDAKGKSLVARSVMGSNGVLTRRGIRLVEADEDTIAYDRHILVTADA